MDNNRIYDTQEPGEPTLEPQNFYVRISETRQSVSIQSFKAERKSRTWKFNSILQWWCYINLVRLLLKKKNFKNWLNVPPVSPGSAGLNAQSTVVQTVKHLLSWQWGFPICMLHIFSFLLSFISLIHSFYASPTCTLSPYYLFHFAFFLPLSLSKCFGERLSADKCIRFRLSLSFPLSISVSLSQQEKRGTLLNQSACPRANPAHYKASSSSSSCMGTNQ